MASTPQLYRSALRQFTQNSIQPRAKRSPTIASHLRQLFENSRAFKVGSTEAAAFERSITDMVVFMKAHRLHKALVERYNPTTGMTQEERNNLTVKRVGLEMPEAFSPDHAPTLEGDRSRRMQAVKAEKEGKGSLQTMMGHIPFQGE